MCRRQTLSAGMSGIAWRGNLSLVKGHGNDLVTAEIADVADLNHQIVARLILDVEREVHAVGQLVGAVVDAECVTAGSPLFAPTVPSIIAAALGKIVGDVGGFGIGWRSGTRGAPWRGQVVLRVVNQLPRESPVARRRWECNSGTDRLDRQRCTKNCTGSAAG